MDYVLLLAGLLGLFFGGDWLVKGAAGLAARLGLSTFIISLTVVGFGTSMPELLVSVRAALDGAPELALGNVIGSNIANIGLIVGLAALISPIAFDGENRRDLFAMAAITVLLGLILWQGHISALTGGFLCCCLLAYLWLAYSQDRGSDGLEMPRDMQKVWQLAGWLAAGIGLLVLGAEMLVRGAVGLASDFGISEAVIGLTVVAVGTSLPELATSVVAALRGKADIAIGNVVGSNIFNILGILGITALVTPVPVATRFLAVDFWVLLGATAGFVALLLFRGRVGRSAAFAGLFGYGAYTVVMY